MFDSKEAIRNKLDRWEILNQEITAAETFSDVGLTKKGGKQNYATYNLDGANAFVLNVFESRKEELGCANAQIPGFNLTVKFWNSSDGVFRQSGSDLTVVIPNVAASGGYMVTVDDERCGTAQFVTFDIPLTHTSDYYINMFAIPISAGASSSVDESIQTAVETIADAVFTDGASFTVSSSKTMSVAGIVNPSDTLTAGQTAAIAVNENREIIPAGYDAVNEALPIERIDGDDQKFKPSKKTWSSETKAEHWDMDGYGDITLGVDIASGSLTLQTSNNYEGDATAITTWHTVAGYSAITTDTLAQSDQMNNCKWVKAVSTAAATATIYAKQKQ